MPDDQTQQQTQQVQQQVKEPETFSREYVTELRGENATYRTKAKEAAAKAEAAEAAAKKAAEEAEAKIKEAGTAAEQRIIRAELKAAALKAGMVDLDGLKLADLSTVKLNDKGEVEGAEALMETMKKAKPYLFQSGSSTSSTDPKPKPGDTKPANAKEMTKEQYEAEKKKLTGSK
jgi:hypothetical protein